ncbi:MAG TPA: SDR family oxidoreductase [Herpetosiphonaceae bacterium]
MEEIAVVQRPIQRVLVTGGCGYIGSALVPRLLAAGYQVTVLDLMLFGYQPPYRHANLQILAGDIRDRSLIKQALHGQDAVIHLAFISNDPKYELPVAIGREINVGAFRPLVEESVSAGVHRFILASSCSVYGKRADARAVTEADEPNPLTEYAVCKLACERILSEYTADDFTTVAVRPATVCGCADRQRFDLTFNQMTCLAYYQRAITVPNSGSIRPYLHIDDMTRLYLQLLELPAAAISGKTWNVAQGNQTLLESAALIQAAVGPDVVLTAQESQDTRSYSVSSRQIAQEINFTPQLSLATMVEQFQAAFKQNKYPGALEDKRYYNIRVQKEYPWRMYHI